MALEPGLILLMEAPALVLEGFCCKILLISALAVVKSIEQGVGVDTRIYSGIIQHWEWLLWVIRRSVETDIWLVELWFFRIHHTWAIDMRGNKHSLC